MGNFVAPYIDIYDSEDWNLQTPDFSSNANTGSLPDVGGGSDSSGSTASILSGLGNVFAGIGSAVGNVIRAQQGAVIDPRTGRLIAYGGQPVYSPSSSLSGLLYGGSILPLALIGLLIYWVLKK
jgi:hypothetical protein